MSTQEITLRTRVVITKDGQGRWFARGLDIDYAAQGKSLLGVERAFESGFVDTVKEHIKTYGHLDYFRKSAPNHVIDKYLEIAEELEADEVVVVLQGLQKVNEKYNIAEFLFYEAA